MMLDLTFGLFSFTWEGDPESEIWEWVKMIEYQGTSGNAGAAPKKRKQ